MSAIISACGQYRYLLTRPALDPVGAWRAPAAFIMLNPSTADASADDPTIRRCRGFADAWGCNGIEVFNLYGLRATNPAALKTHPDPIGPEGDHWIDECRRRHETIVLAWGGNADPARAAAVVERLRSRNLVCLGVTKAGQPGHPLYIAKARQLEPFLPART